MSAREREKKIVEIIRLAWDAIDEIKQMSGDDPISFFTHVFVYLFQFLAIILTMAGGLTPEAFMMMIKKELKKKMPEEEGE